MRPASSDFFPTNVTASPFSKNRFCCLESFALFALVSFISNLLPFNLTMLSKTTLVPSLNFAEIWELTDFAPYRFIKPLVIVVSATLPTALLIVICAAPLSLSVSLRVKAVDFPFVAHPTALANGPTPGRGSNAAAAVGPV